MYILANKFVGAFLLVFQLSKGEEAKLKQNHVAFFPTYFPYGNYPRIMTDVYFGTPIQENGISIVVDQGSANYWVYQKGAIVNYGSQFLGQLGPCNVTARPSYDYKASKTATKRVEIDAGYSYGGNGKLVSAPYAVNDTTKFSKGKFAPSFTNNRVALSNFTLVRQAATNCKGKSSFQYDHGILGVSRYRNPSFPTTGPSFRQDLLDSGEIQSSTMSMWFDHPPNQANGTFYGTALFGGLPSDKYKGPLVLVKLSPPKNQGYVGYYIPAPSIETTNVNGDNKKTQLKTGKTPRCLIDSGTGNENLAISQRQFEKAAGLITSGGYPAYNGSCDALAKSGATLSFTFPGLNKGKSVMINVPLSNYARGTGVTRKNRDKCPLSMELSTGYDCVLGASFNTAMFLAVNDGKNELALAQGGISRGARHGSQGLGRVISLGPNDSLTKAGAV